MERTLIVGAGISRRYPAAQLGRSIHVGRHDWTVVGIFTGKDDSSAIGSEIWGDLNQVRDDFNRQGGASSLLVRAPDRQTLLQLITAVEDDRRLNATANDEQKYYASMTSSGAPLEVLGIMIAGIMAIGSGFGAMNTMYAAVARRGKEIGTLRALGFSRWSILQSFVFESVVLAVIGGIAGCLIALPINNVTTGVGNFATFSEVAFKFKVGPGVIARGLLFSAMIGAIGGFLPARAAARRDLITTLREA